MRMFDTENLQNHRGADEDVGRGPLWAAQCPKKNRLVADPGLNLSLNLTDNLAMTFCTAN